jgi:hypothetical protein
LQNNTPRTGIELKNVHEGRQQLQMWIEKATTFNHKFRLKIATRAAGTP